jgi:hypothetical protein
LFVTLEADARAFGQSADRPITVSFGDGPKKLVWLVDHPRAIAVIRSFKKIDL